VLVVHRGNWAALTGRPSCFVRALARIRFFILVFVWCACARGFIARARGDFSI
jgi:hypothetical protein